MIIVEKALNISKSLSGIMYSKNLLIINNTYLFCSLINSYIKYHLIKVNL